MDDSDYEAYTGFLARVVKRQGWNLLCYCLMPNHVHLLIETPETNLANGMQWLHARYAAAFNRRHVRKGHLFEAPYKSPLIKSDEDFVRAVGYIVVNPVTAVLCKRGDDWPWGSHAAVANGRVPDWLAHDLVLNRLELITGLDCYDDLIASCERQHDRDRY